MPFPTAYEREFGFQGFQDTHPNTPLPGLQVDAELDNAAESTAALVTFIKKFSRADGKLANGSVGVDQLAADLVIGFKAPTVWESGISYSEDSTVFYGSGFYTCVIAHTSGDTFAPGNWSLIVDFGSQAQAAAASAASAADSAATATMQAGTATTQAGIATTKAGEANDSANAAAASESNAAVSESNVAASEAIAEAAAAQAVAFGSIWSTPFGSVAASAPVSPSEGDKYINTSDQKGYAYLSGAWDGTSPANGQIVFNAGDGFSYKFNGTAWIKRRSKLAYVSDFDTLANALAYAAAANVRLVVDDDRTLAADASISSAIPAVHFDGGKITLGNYDLTFDGQDIRAENETLFVIAGTGRVNGTLDAACGVLPDWFGALGDDSADDTDAIQMAMDFANGRKMCLGAEKTYRISSASNPILVIPAGGLDLSGAGRRSSKIKVATASKYMLLADVSNVHISDVGFVGAGGSSCVVAGGGAISNIRLRNIRTDQTGLIYVQSSGGSQAANNDGNSPSDIEIVNCEGFAPSGSPVDFPFIWLLFTRNARIRGCYAEYYRDGIMLWGGDSAYNVDGAPGNTRKCRDIRIADCHFKNISGGGIWGSMCRDVEVSDCSVDTSGDVGFDAEGCEEFTFRGGKVRNCANGCLTTFWCNRNVLFENVDVEMSGSYTIAYRNYNATGDATLNESVTIRGGHWISLTGTGVVDHANGPVHYFTIENVKARDVVFNLDNSGTKSHAVTVRNNELLFTREISASYSGALKVGRLEQDGARQAVGRVEGNKVRSNVSQPNTGQAILLRGTDVNDTALYVARDNETSGFTRDIYAGDDAGHATYIIGNNECRTKVIEVSGLNVSSVLVKYNNRGFDGTSL